MIGLQNVLLAFCFPLLLLHYVIVLHSFFFCLGFLSPTFKIHRRAMEGKDYFFNLSTTFTHFTKT